MKLTKKILLFDMYIRWKNIVYWIKFSNIYCICCHNKLEQNDEDYTFCNECQQNVKLLCKSYNHFIDYAKSNLREDDNRIRRINFTNSVKKYIANTTDIQHRISKTLFDNMVIIIRTDTDCQHKHVIKSLVIKILRIYKLIQENKRYQAYEVFANDRLKDYINV